MYKYVIRQLTQQYLLNVVGAVCCGVNPAAVRHHNAAADQRRCSLQPAVCMQTQKCGGRRQLAPTLALAGVPRKALNLSRWPDWSGTAALQHCSQVPRVLWRACSRGRWHAAGAGTRDHLTSTRCKSVIVVRPLATQPWPGLVTRNLFWDALRRCD